jgi:hypothetical protein
MEPIPSTEGIVGTAGRMPLLAWTFDMNGDGVLDITQPEQVAKMLTTLLREVAPLLPDGGKAPITLALQILPRLGGGQL